MGVHNWPFNTEQTIQNSSLLAASPYFQEWRQARCRRSDDAADASALKTTVRTFNRGAGLFCSIYPWIFPSMRKRCGSGGGESAVPSRWIFRNLAMRTPLSKVF